MVRIISALFLAVTAACATAQEPVKLVDNPPEHYTVVKGDTLWGISGRFLQEPWRWPEIWRMNKEQISNQHLIYPGDTVYLDYSDGKPRLRLGKAVSQSAPRDDRLKPQIYAEKIQESIPSIPPNAIEPYLSRPLIIQAGEDEKSPRIVASQEDRIMLGLTDSFYATGIPDASVIKWQLYRPGKPLKDPVTKEILGYEAFFLGNAELTRPGEPATLRVTLAKEEIARGDRLLPAPTPEIINYVPHAPASRFDARIVSIYGGMAEGGPGTVISINRGAQSELEIGHVLALSRSRVSVSVDTSGERTDTPVPDERHGLAIVFRVFDRISYALVVRSSKSVIVGDYVGNP